jgi:SAM-dependent methyltransferase
MSGADVLLDDAKRQPFSGWDFSWLAGRITSEPLPWDYTAIVAEHAATSPDLLDLGTGGGEWLAALPDRPPRTAATEAWAPNVPIARSRLEPLGVTVVQVAPARDNSGRPVVAPRVSLPFPDASFHLVVDRHEAFEVSEVARILARGGWFITQQVDAGNDRDFRALLGIEESEPGPDEMWAAWMPRQLKEAGLSVVEHASAPLVQRIHDVGALAYELKAMPWMVPGFTIDGNRERLRKLQSQIEHDGPLIVRQHRFFVRARKP